MADTQKIPQLLLDELAALDGVRRREVAAALRSVTGARRGAHRREIGTLGYGPD